MNKAKQRKIETLQNIHNIKNPIYYIGPMYIGNYGEIDKRLSYKETRKLYGATAYALQTENVCLVMDKRSKVIIDNLYENGKGNLFFVNINDKSTWSHYFNKEDSRILLKYFRRAGKKNIPEIKEELFKIISEYKLKRYYDKYCHNKIIFIDGREKKFSSYKLFKKEFRGWAGFGGEWKLEAPEAPDYLIIRQHYMAAFDWWTIE